MKEIREYVKETIELAEACIEYNESCMDDEINKLTDLTRVEAIITEWQGTTIRTIASCIDESRGALWFAYLNGMIKHEERDAISQMLTDKYMELVKECYRRIS